MLNSTTSVELDNRIIKIQNNKYYNPESVKVNPKAALAMAFISALATTVINGTSIVISTAFIDDGICGIAIGSGVGFAITAAAFKDVKDMKDVYDSGRFALDTVGSIIGECINFGDAEV